MEIVMSVQDGLSPEVRQATRRVSQILEEPTEAADVIVSTVVEICLSFPQPLSAIDLVLALQPPARCQLEMIAMQRFQKQQRNRLGSSIPRPVTELRSASRAWKLSPLVLLIEFANAPISDNFWRLLSRLARASKDWRTARECLLEKRHRRQHDLLSRRQGLSYTQPWTIPDIQAVLRQKALGDEMNRSMQEKGQTLWKGSRDALAAAKTVKTSNINSATVRCEKSGEIDEHGSTRTGEPLHSANVQDPVVPIQRANSEYSRGDSNAWSISIGWWLSGDSIHRICDSLLQYQSSFLSVDPQIVSPPPIVSPRRYQQAASTLFLPIYTKQALHWNLCVFSLEEKIVSLYITLPDHVNPVADMASTIESSFHMVLPDEAFSDWSVVKRGCPSLRNGADSGVAVIIFMLYYVCGRALPSEFSFWLWRRMLAIYITRASYSSAGAEQAAKDASMADQMAAGVTEMFRSEIEKDSLSNYETATGCKSRKSVLLSSVVEARSVWTATADLVCKSETDELSPHAENSIAEAREPVPRAAGLSYAMNAVLRDLNWLVSWLTESTSNNTFTSA